MLQLVKKPKEKPVSLQEFYQKRNKVLIKRRTGGFGDIVMSRMMFEDFKNIMPEADFTYTLPPQFMCAASEHPYINQVVNIKEVKERDYGVVYDISTICQKYETKFAPYCNTHRSDIWAKHCGVDLINHNSYLQVPPEMKKICHDICKNKPPMVIITSHASQNDDFGVGRSLLDHQIKWIVDHIREQGFWPVAIHSERLKIYEDLKVQQFCGVVWPSWVGLIDAAKYVITVATASFVIAGALKKPMTGIFTYVDGKTYGRHFDFILVQRHRDNGDWDCGPCFQPCNCPKASGVVKPCLSELTKEEILGGLDLMFQTWPILRNH